ncbi:MAG: D-glycerate dehydrogenase [Gemmatimonadaceae bacterium]
MGRTGRAAFTATHLSVSRPVVVCTRRLPPPVEATMRSEFDAVLSEHDGPMPAADIAAALRTADGILCTVADRLTSELLRAPGRRARILANFGVGFDNIAVEAARAGGIVVTNTPEVVTDDTADLAITLMLMAARRAGEGERILRSGRWSGWNPTQLLGARLTGKTLGLVGFGRIGRAVARRARRGFDMRVLYCRSSAGAPGAALEEGAQQEQLDALLAESDVVSLHTPASPATHHLLNAARIRLMKPSAIVVNTARGGVVDEAALAEALRTGRLAAAGLDVFETEPAVPASLRSLENVVLLPHLGTATWESRVAMGQRAIANLTAFFRGEPPPDRVA